MTDEKKIEVLKFQRDFLFNWLVGNMDQATGIYTRDTKESVRKIVRNNMWASHAVKIDEYEDLKL